MCPRIYSNLKIVFTAYILICVPLKLVISSTRPIDRDARTLYLINNPPKPNGDFYYEFQTTNGITTKTGGNENGFSGVVQYVSLEGIPITMTYVADADGYHPMGEHIPATPEHVLKSLNYIETHPQVDEKKSRKL
ncbi:pupal cuticle protein Edg-78E [Teleopsis dalmanni]|uniref:pupal cuticle protein Edg-78E n=1 Tax=Teleopsis dalmanni TaxID=139649 RepID=UPI000D32C5EC|nr:pupal cuticle protein Edg-78E [Teleopsis dalmanni]